MPYGERARRLREIDLGVGDYVTLAIAGGAGIVSALVADFFQKGEASALFVLNRWARLLGDLAGLPAIPLWAVMLALIVGGAASIFYFQPVTRQGAFTQGFAVLATVMTVAPADLPAGVESAAEGELAPMDPDAFDAFEEIDNIGGETPGEEPEAVAQGIALRSADNGATARASSAAALAQERYNVRITITFPNGLDGDWQEMVRRQTLRGRLYNAETGTRYALFRTSGGLVREEGNTLVVFAGVPAEAATTTLWIRIEADGYAIQESSIEARAGRATAWSISMEPSNSPLAVQRLRWSYWF